MISFPISDIDECAIHTDDCHDHATCTDTEESYTCSCNDGWTGDGFTCSCEYLLFGPAQLKVSSI